MPGIDAGGRVADVMARFGAVPSAGCAVSGVGVIELAERFSTPLYVYSGDVLTHQLERLRRALGPDTDVYFSVKANPSLGVCELLAREGAGVEVASVGELLLAQRAGFAPEKTLFAGPGKTDEELSLACSAGIFAVNVESEGELARLERIAAESGTVVGVGVRINPRLELAGAKMRMGGGAQRFGIDEEALPPLLARAKRSPYLKVRGPHLYAGTQIFDVETLATQLHHIVDLSGSMADALGRPLEMIDFGGGFGVPYFEGMEPFDLTRLQEIYRGVVERCKVDPRLREARLIIELGRYLAAEAGVYVTRVVDVKRSRGERFVVTDGGMHHHITATGNFGQVFRKPYPISLLSRPGSGPREPATLVGPCCTPLDTLAQGLPFPEVGEGDLIGVFMSGAYGYSASSLAFLSHPTPAEVMVWRGEVYELRPPGRPDAVLQGQRSLSLHRERLE